MSQNDPRWNRIKALFAAAQTVPEAERETFLRERGAGPDTVHEVLDLLGAHVVTEEQPGDLIGPYKLLENLGEGGFGAVWMAEQRAPVQRLVALKVLKAGMDSAQVLARFEQERQALALMQHPHIAQVYDAGTTPRGRPFFVMELVKGIPITDYASRERLTIQQRLELFVQVCRAVQHAHHKGVVHRDIKPRNVLVATVDGRPMAKVIDFGIAKATSGRLTERTLFTEHRAMVGTLEYTSPEQAEGLLDVDTRADVYSLGALLYELLTGSTPFAADKLLAAGFGELLRTLREVEPERPSVRVSSKAGAGWVAGGSLGGRDPKELFGSLRGDLDWVVMKALEKDRARRYGTADGLAADVERYLGGEAVEAVPPSVGYRLRKFVRKHRTLVAASTTIVLVLLVAFGRDTLALREARIARKETQDKLAQLDQIARSASGTFQRVVGIDERQADIKVTHNAEGEAVAAGDHALQLSLAMLAELEQHGKAVAWSNRVLDYAGHLAAALTMSAQRSYQTAVQELANCPEEMRGFEWRYASTQVDEGPRRILTPEPVQFRVTDDGRLILCLQRETRRLLVFDAETLKALPTHALPLPDPYWIDCYGLLDGLFAEGSNPERDGRIYVHLPSGNIHVIASGTRHFPARGRYATLRGRLLELHDGESGQVERMIELDEIDRNCMVQVLPGGRYVLYERWARHEHPDEVDRAVLIDTEDPARRFPVPGRLWINDQGTLHLGDGNWLFDEAYGTVARSAWNDPASNVVGYLSPSHALTQFGGFMFNVPERHHAVVQLVQESQVSPALPLDSLGSIVAPVAGGHRCLNGHQQLEALSIETGDWLGQEPGRPDTQSELTRDGISWVHSRPQGIEVTSARPPQLAPAHGDEPILALQPAERHDTFAVRSTTQSSDTLFVPDTGVPHRHTRSTRVHLAVTSGDGSIQLRLLEGGHVMKFRHLGQDRPESIVSDLPCSAMAIDNAGAIAALVSGDRLLQLDLASNNRLIERARLVATDDHVALAIHGERIAVGRHDGSLLVHDPTRGTPLTVNLASRVAVTHLAWSPSGSHILVGTGDGACVLLRASDFRQLSRMAGHIDAIRASTWSPDGARVFTCALDGTVRCWPTDGPDVDVLTPLLTLTEPEIAGLPTTLLMTPNGERLACGYDDGSIRVWDSVPWSERAKHVQPLFPSAPK